MTGPNDVNDRRKPPDDSIDEENRSAALPDRNTDADDESGGIDESGPTAAVEPRPHGKGKP